MSSTTPTPAPAPAPAPTPTPTPTTMKAGMLHKNGDPTDPSVFDVQDSVEVPVPTAGELLIKVKAASINPVDWKIIKGDFPGRKAGTMGFDVSGVIESVGPETSSSSSSSWKVGDAIYADGAATFGSFAEYMIVKKVAASLKPKNIDFCQAAALPLAGLTALQGLVTHGNFQQGQKVAILGGSGGVGSLAIQIAKSMGALEIYSTGSSVELIKGFGADVVVNYKEQSVLEEFKGKDFDLVFDTIGGYKNWEAAQGGLKQDGIFVTIVGDGGSMSSTIAKMMWRKFMSFLPIIGGPAYNLFLTSTDAPAVIEDMKTLTGLVEGGKVKPVLDERTFSLTTESVHDMIKASMSHRAKGKLVLKVDC